MATDWVEWHDSYEDPHSAHGSRLAIVQGHIADALTNRPPGPIRVASACSGDGRDLLGVLERHPRAGDVRARLVELEPSLAERARLRCRTLGLDAVEVVTGDASTTDAFAGAVPADLVLFCGVFGNISDEDVARTVSLLRSLCAPDATVVWTRHRREPDLTPKVRAWFSAAQFAEVAFDAPEPPEGIDHGWVGVGVHRLIGAPDPFQPGQRMFRFTR